MPDTFELTTEEPVDFLRQLLTLLIESAHPEPGTVERIPHAEAFFENVAKHGGMSYAEDKSLIVGSATGEYDPYTERVGIRPIHFFPAPEAYYRVLAHEATHWTSRPLGRTERRDIQAKVFDAKKRPEMFAHAPDLKREFRVAKAREELVAELGAGKVVKHLGLDTPLNRDERAEYLAHYSEKLAKASDKPVQWHRDWAEEQAHRAAEYLFALQHPLPSSDS